MASPCPGTVMPMATDILTATGTWRFVKHDAASGRVLSDRVYKNVVPTVARTALAKQLTGTATYNCEVSYVAIGTGGGTPAASDTQLTTELTRKSVASISSSSNVLTVTGFFNEGEGNGTLTEAALFGDGNASTATASANSGILYSRVAISETKTSSETLSLTWTLTFS